MSKSNFSALMATSLLAAVLLAGCERGVFLPWQCSDPVALEGEPEGAVPNSYQLQIWAHLDLAAVAAEFEVDPGIEVEWIGTVTPWMIGTMTVTQREVLRCDPRVVRVTYTPKGGTSGFGGR